MILLVLTCVAACGWSVAGYLYTRQRRHRCPVTPPTYAVLVNGSGLPESLRALRGPAPKTYSRPHGRGPATIYHPLGTATVYQPKS